MRNLFTLAILFTLLATTAGWAVTDNVFPRPFQYAGTRSTGWPLLTFSNNSTAGHSYPPLTETLNEDAIRAYARYPMVCLDLQPTFNHRHDIIEKIKEINPQCKVLVYVLAGHYYLPVGSDPTNDVLVGISQALYNYNEVSASKAYLYDTDGNLWLDNYNVNLGDVNVRAALISGWEKVLSDPLVDGLFIDCLNYTIGWTTPSGGRTLDYVQAGYTDLSDMDVKFTISAAMMLATLRAKYPTKVFATNSNVEQSQYATLSGRMWEGWPSQNPGQYPATWAGINSSNLSELSYYNTYKSEHASGTGTYTGLALSSVYGWAATAKARYILGSASLGEGWSTYAFDRSLPNYGSGPNNGKYVTPAPSLWWYDEYSVNVTTGLAYAQADTTGAHTGWLGKAKAAAYQITGQINAGLWVRNFEHGTVLVNPTGSEVSYTSNIPLKRIRGIRDTTVNNGSYGLTFTVPYQSALFLVNALPDTLATAITAVKVRPNMTSAAVSAWVVGDADTNATLQIFYRRFNAAAYDSGMVMVRRPGGKQNISGDSYWATNYEGRILHLATGRKYQYYLKLSQLVNSQVVAIATSPDTFHVDVLPKIQVNGIEFAPFAEVFEESEDPTGGGTLPPPANLTYKVYVRQNGGADINDGETWATAVATLARAKEIASVSLGNASILVYPGHYHEALNLNWGTAPPNQQRWLLGMASTADSVIICGANPTYEAGYLTPTRRFLWSLVGGGIYKTFFPDTACFNFVIGSERLVRKTSQADLASSTHGYHGWYRTNDTLYVRLNNNQSPAGRKLYFGNKAYGINVATRNWRISNIRIQYTGYDAHPTGSGADVHYEGYGVSMGLNGHASGTTIDHCKIIGTGQYPIYSARGGYGTYHVDSVTVVRNYIDGMFTDGYSAGKTRTDEALTVSLNGSRTLFNYNTVRRLFNGVYPSDESSTVPLADSTLGSWSEVTNNTFKLIADDAIELDSYQVINRLIEQNTIDSCGTAISFSPTVLNGPAFVFYNRITNCLGGLKLGGGSDAPTILYHNTIIGKRPMFNPGGEVRNMVFKNNILWGRNTAYTMDFGEGFAPWQTSSFNYNVYDSTSTTAMVLYAGVIQSSIVKTRNYQPKFELNGKQGMVGIQSLDRGDYRLRWPSNAIDTGCRIAGVNTSDRGPMYYIKPDMGCYEFVPGLKIGN